ncbi:MAG TPA: ACT domain-containing protein [Nitriliruptorales bacterium]|nr:ACT domain-containing protein [Nitriliruptorales bacterium]
MAWDLTVMLPDRPGTFADAATALGAAGVNIEGVCGIPFQGQGVVHLLVEDASQARRALEGAGIAVTDENEVLVLECPDRPGEVAKLARALADAGINIKLLYLATRTRVVFGVDDVAKAAAALS